MGHDTAIVLTGGGARAAYQVGFLNCLAELAPDYHIPIITGVSAGAINAAFLAAHRGGIAEAADELANLWGNLEVSDVFRTGGFALAKNVMRWALRLISGGSRLAPEVSGLVDTAPLAQLLTRRLGTANGELTGITDKLEAGLLKAAALTTINYATGQTTTWVQGCDIQTWQRSDRCSAKVRLTIDHVMASAALPLLFPAVRLGDAWHGDGGIRMAAPLSPALHLGARRIIAVSTRHRSAVRQNELSPDRHPPPAQIMGKLLNAIFLDVIDQDAQRLELINQLIRKLPPEDRQGMKEVDILVLRPSVDLGKLAAEYEPRLPPGFRFMTRGLGTRETSSPDFLSLLMFQPDYLRRVMEIGRADAQERCDEIARMVFGQDS